MILIPAPVKIVLPILLEGEIIAVLMPDNALILEPIFLHIALMQIKAPERNQMFIVLIREQQFNTKAINLNAIMEIGNL